MWTLNGGIKTIMEVRAYSQQKLAFPTVNSIYGLSQSIQSCYSVQWTQQPFQFSIKFFFCPLNLCLVINKNWCYEPF